MQIAFQGALSSQGLQVPVEFTVHQNHPNPFNPITNIKLDLNQTEFISVKVYNIVGKAVMSLFPSSDSTTVDIAHLANGIYIAEILTASKKEMSNY